MRRTWAQPTILLLMGASLASSNDYLVKTTADSGIGSLRQAITDASLHAGPDRILFDGSLKGQVIRPTAALPQVTGSGTEINGDIDSDGKPDVVVDGWLVFGEVYGGIYVWADDCVVRGLVVRQFPLYQVNLSGGSGNTLAGCHINTDLPGEKPVVRADSLAVAVVGADTVGLPGLGGRNVICPGEHPGVWVFDDRAKVQNNWIGVRASGSGTFFAGVKGFGIEIGGHDVVGCQVGGRRVEERNVIAGVNVGIWITGADTCDNHVQGNWIGLNPDGTSTTGCVTGVYFEGGHNNVIGGRLTGAGNVIAGTLRGVDFGAGAGRANSVEGNLFGMDPAGLTAIPQEVGVLVQEACEKAQTVGGEAAAAGNCFAGGTGIQAAGPAGGLIAHNTFGAGPTGTELAMGAGILCDNSSPRVADNVFAQAQVGLCARSGRSRPVVVGNEFRRCGEAVRIARDAQPNLGNLGNASSQDNGGNVFSLLNTYDICNRGTPNIRAEGNSFGTTVASEIDAKIIDHGDRVRYGTVDYLPLTGVAAGLAATVQRPISCCCTPSRTGFEITIALAGQAAVSVEVLNVAGRHLRWLARDLPTGTGVHRLTWDARTDTGLALPGGTYLVRVFARGGPGAEAQSVTAAVLRR